MSGLTGAEALGGEALRDDAGRRSGAQITKSLGARPRSVYSFLGWKATDGFSMVVEVVVEGYFGQGDFSGCGLRARLRGVHRWGNKIP